MLRRKEQLPDIINIIFFLETAFSVLDSKLLKTIMSSIVVQKELKNLEELLHILIFYYARRLLKSKFSQDFFS